MLQQVINGKKTPSEPFLIILNNNLTFPLETSCRLRLDAIEGAKYRFFEVESKINLVWFIEQLGVAVTHP
jgi:hypothetical protein